MFLVIIVKHIQVVTSDGAWKTANAKAQFLTIVQVTRFGPKCDVPYSVTRCRIAKVRSR